MIELIRNNRLGFLLYAMLLITGITLVLAVPKTELHLLLNSNHSDLLDSFFKIITWLGDGWFAVILSLPFLFLRFRYFLMIILSFSVSGILVQFFKRVVFPEALRPAAFLEHMEGLELVPGIGLYQTLSFPSGHTTTTFAVLLICGLITGNRTAFFLSMMLAWCVAFSRVYLSQHFLGDILAGSCLGILSALFFYWYFQRLKPDWLDRSLLNLPSKRHR